MKKYLESTDIIDWKTDAVLEKAQKLSGDSTDNGDIALKCFEFVRDGIIHSGDKGDGKVTLKASEVLKEGTGFCYAKSHLLAALLRANQIPAGLCYQRLSINGRGAPYCLHGLNAVHLEDSGWYRIDARGGSMSSRTMFRPPREYLAYTPENSSCIELVGIFSSPLDEVVKALKSCNSVYEVNNNLPDIYTLKHG